MNYKNPDKQNTPFKKSNSNFSNISQPEPEEVKKSFKDYNDETLISEIAEKVADIIHKEGSTQGKNKNSQIRKFYDELSGIKLKIDMSQDQNAEFQNSKPIIYLLASKAAYAYGRGKIGLNLFNFLKNNILNIKSADELKRFLLYFEAILGYYRFKNPREN